MRNTAAIFRMAPAKIRALLSATPEFDQNLKRIETAGTAFAEMIEQLVQITLPFYRSMKQPQSKRTPSFPGR